MKYLLLALVLFMSGCGYTFQTKTTKIKFGAIHNDLLMAVAEREPKDQRAEEALKHEGKIYGILIERTF